MVRTHKQLGFTLIEMIVSLAVFAGVITIAVGALLVLVATSNQLQQDQNIMVNLSFALDSMTREIRTGTNYYCETSNDYASGGPNNIFDDGNDLDDIYLTGPSPGPLDCVGGKSNAGWALHGLSFEEAGNSITEGADRIVYFHDADTGQILRRIATGAAAPITSSNIYIHDVDFFVTGSDPQSAGGGAHYDQASVTIYIEASATSTTAVADRYTIQTTVTQRTLDI